MGGGGGVLDLFKLFYNLTCSAGYNLILKQGFLHRIPYLPVFSSINTIRKVLVDHHGLLLLHHAVTILLLLSALVVGLLVLFIDFW